MLVYQRVITSNKNWNLMENNRGDAATNIISKPLDMIFKEKEVSGIVFPGCQKMHLRKFLELIQ
jgi:hypothetical protein